MEMFEHIVQFDGIVHIAMHWNRLLADYIAEFCSTFTCVSVCCACWLILLTLYSSEHIRPLSVPFLICPDKCSWICWFPFKCVLLCGGPSSNSSRFFILSIPTVLGCESHLAKLGVETGSFEPRRNSIIWLAVLYGLQFYLVFSIVWLAVWWFSEA